MALESFYGGKPGYSPVIKGTFKYISENDSKYRNLTEDQKNAAKAANEVMNLCFQDPEYKDVWYGEICIISSDSMYDANNGKIFRRTLKKQSSLDETYGSLYAEYLGQIVGMPGGLPKVVFNTIDTVKNQAANAENDIWYPTGVDNNNVVETDYKPIDDTSATSYPATLSGSEGIEFVPGMQKNNNTTIYNDNLQYTWLQILDPQSNQYEADGSASTLQIGLKIPYLYLDTPTVTPVSYFNNPKITESDIGQDNKHHPFYRKYNISIPDGLRGLGIKNLRIETKESLQGTNLLDPTAENFFSYDASKRNIIIKEDALYDLTNYNNDSPFWVYDLDVPNKTDESLMDSSFYTCYAGDYHKISDVTLNSNGSLSFTSNYGETITTKNKLKWITGTEVVTDVDQNDYGKFTINYNFNPSSSNSSVNQNKSDTYHLPFVKRIFAYTSSEEKDGEEIKIELVNGDGGIRTLTLEKPTTPNTPAESYSLKYPTSVKIIEKDNDDQYYFLQAEYNDGDKKELGRVGLRASIDGIASTIYVGQLNSNGNIERIPEYLPDNVREEAIVLVDETVAVTDNITSNLFPSFNVS